MAKKTYTPEEKAARELELEELARVKSEAVDKHLRDMGLTKFIVARIGHWVWIEGEDIKESAPAREWIQAKEGFRWSKTRLAFGWAPYAVKRGKPSPLKLDQLAHKYGYGIAGR